MRRAVDPGQCANRPRTAPIRRRLLLSCAVAACSSGSDDGRSADDGVQVRDSAGIRIVENKRAVWRAATGWRVAAEPSLTIGAVDGDSVYLLSRVNGAARLSDGRIVVADGGSSQLRFFDSTGRFLTAAGRSGEGPGEFEFLNRVWRRPGDSLAVTDRSPRVSYFGPDGRYVRAVHVRPSEELRVANVVGIATDGTMLAIGGSRGFGAADAGRVLYDTIQLYRLTPTGAGGGLLARLPGQERWGLRAGSSTSFPFLPFSPPTAYAAGADQFAMGAGRSPEVGVWNHQGKLVRIVRWSAERRAVTRALLDQYRAHELEGEGDPNERRRVEQFLAEAPVADTLPVYQSLLVDDSGHLWVEAYRPPWEREPTWEVFAPDGRWLGRIRTPVRLRILHIGGDFVLGRWRDENDVEHVRLYPLVRRQ